MSFLPALLVYAGSFVIGKLFPQKSPKIRRMNAAPQAFEEITVDDGRPLPIVFGTRRIKNLNMGWYGDRSQVAIVDGGVTVGYKYYLGAQYPVCTGPIDAVEDLTWNESAVGKGIGPGTDGIVFGKLTPWTTVAHVAPGNYGTAAALAYAAEQAMKAAEPGNWKVTFGFTIVAGRNSVIRWALRAYDYAEGRTVYWPRSASIPAGEYTGASLAFAITTAVNAVETVKAIEAGYAHPSVLTCAYSANRFQMSMALGDWLYHGANGWALCGADFTGAPFSYADTVNSTIGYRMDLTREGNTALAPDFDVLVKRFIFAYGGTGAKLKLTNAGFTAAAAFGLSIAADVELLSKTGDSDYTSIEAVYTPTADYLQVDIDDADFFGTEGGVSGRLDIYWGSLAQAASGYLTTKFGSAAPPWPGLCQIVQRGMYVGNTNVPKPLGVTVRRCPNQLGLTDERHNISGDANPACMIWEILTDTRWGLGRPETDLDKAAFIAAGETLAAEAFGLSMLLDATAAGYDVIDEILAHVGGRRYTDPITSLIGIRLIRHDYSPAGVPVANASNVDACSLRRRSWGETVNVIRARFTDRDSQFVERTVVVQDLASVQSQGGIVTMQDVTFAACSRRETAEVAANRLLKAVSWPTAEVTLRADHTLWKLREGDPFVLTWSPLGILAMPCRVDRVRSSPLEDGVIEIDATEDVEGQAWLGFAAAGGAGGTSLSGYGIDYGLDYGGT